MIKDFFEERIDKETFEPQYKVCGKWMPASALYDAPLFFEKSEYLQIMTQEYGPEVAAEIEEKLFKNKEDSIKSS